MRYLALLMLLVLPAVHAAGLAVRAGTLYPVAGDPIENAVVLIEGGRIVWVGPAALARIPAGTATLEAAAVTPGLVDVHSVVGLSGVLNTKADQNQLETSDPTQPELRAIDAYVPTEPLVAFVRSMGVTTLHTGHGPGAILSGQTLIAKTRGMTVADSVLRPGVAVAATLGGSVFGNFKSPKTHAKNAAVLRQELLAAQHYRDKRAGDKAPDRDIGKESLVAVLDGERALMITAHTATEIATALRLREEFGFTLWLDGAAEAYRVIEPIRDAGVPVLLHPTMTRARGDARNASMATAATLAAAGIPFAIQSGFESYVPKSRVLLYEAQVAVHAGLSTEAALRAITLTPAEILGLDDRIGSIEPGKDADLVLYDGDPFEYTSHVCQVLIDGQVVSDDCR